MCDMRRVKSCRRALLVTILVACSVTSAVTAADRGRSTGRQKRDLEEIIRNKPIMYAPMMIARLNRTMMEIRDQLDTLEEYLLYPDNITSPAPPTTEPMSTAKPTTILPTNTTSSQSTSSTGQSPSPSVVTSPPVISTPTPQIKSSEEISEESSEESSEENDLRNLQSHKLFLPILTNNIKGLIKERFRRSLSPIKVFSWPIVMRQQPSNETSPDITSTDSGTAPSSSTSNSTPKPSTESTLNTTITSESSNVTTEVPSTTLTPNTTDTPIIYPTREDLVEALTNIFNSSEMIMDNQLSQKRVIELEKCSDDLENINSFIYMIDVQSDTHKLLSWLALAKLSVRHCLQRLDEQKSTYGYIEKLDDITSIITAAFCIIAMAIVLYLLYLVSRYRKPYTVTKEGFGESPYRVRHINNNEQPQVGVPEIHPRNFSSPTAQSTRTNPLYSSQRSADGGNPHSRNSNLKADNNGFDPVVSERNERNLAPHPNSPDYRDPSRNRKTNLDQYRGGGRDNAGYIPDEVIEVRPTSESAL